MDNVTILARLESLDKKLFGKALEVAEAASAKLSRIVLTFPHYTSHDEKHKKRVLEICEWLAGPGLITQLTAPELFVLFAAIYLHDIGMVISPTERDVIEKSPEYHSFVSASGLIPEEALAEWVRQIHHRRSAEIIRDTHADVTGIAIRDSALAHATALICESHGENDLEDFNKYDPFFAYGTSATTICLPLLGILLRMSDLLHVTSDRTPLAVLPLVHLTTARSTMEWSKHLSTAGIAPASEGAVRMTCICNDPNVHRDILRLCDYINKEFEYSKRIFAKLEAAGLSKYKLTCDHVVPNISAMGYEPWLDLTFQLDREGIIQLVTGSRIYHGPGAVLKELLMNAVDASRQARSLGKGPVVIHVEFNSAERLLSIADEGVGMDRTDIEEFLLKLGRCVYRSEIYQQRYNPPQQIDALSEFGIGFASCFLVSDHVVVETKREGKDGFLLDLYDLLGFAAARPSCRRISGTRVTLHLKQNVLKDIESAVKGLASNCPHVEIPIHVSVDGNKFAILNQPYCQEDGDLLAPFFRSKAKDLIVERRNFVPELDNITGCFLLLCQNNDGVVMPGYSPWYKLSQENETRRVSQLGFRLPDPSKWPGSLFGKLNVSLLQYDLNLLGDTRLEMDPSRTNILPSKHNVDVISQIDEHVVSFLYDVHARNWAELPRERRLAAHKELGHILFTSVIGEMQITTHKAARRLIDLMFDNMPLQTSSKSKGSCELTWNEIRKSFKSVVFYHRLAYEKDYETHVAAILDALQDVLVVIEEPSYPYGSNITNFCTTKKIHLSDLSKRIYLVVEPWLGNADDLQAYYWDKERFNAWGFIIPFIPSMPYALVSSSATRRSGALSVWVNASHPKIAAFIQATARAERSGKKLPETVRFLQFIHRYHGGQGTDPEYVEYIQQHHQQAITELVSAEVINSTQGEALLLRGEDFVPWDLL